MGIALLAVVLGILGCGGQTPASLVGTTWSEALPLTDVARIFVTFESETECRIGALKGKGAPATYTVEGGLITIEGPSAIYEFRLDGDEMISPGVVLTKE
jgi:hypothetical protein